MNKNQDGVIEISIEIEIWELKVFLHSLYYTAENEDEDKDKESSPLQLLFKVLYTC
jgi:hypothetical protein